MPLGRNPQHVKQSHDPERRLSGHVVQTRTKARNQLLYRLGLREPKTKAEQAEELRRAVENTSGR